MNSEILTTIKQQLSDLSRRSATSTGLVFRQGQSLYLNGQCTPLVMAEKHFEFSVDDKFGDFLVKITAANEPESTCTCNSAVICRHRVAALMQLHELLKLEDDKLPPQGIRYTRKGMIRRVIEERKEKARLAAYSIEFADNIFGEHMLTNERGVNYKLTFRDIKRRHGYCSCPDYRTNKLGTCKHLIYAFEKLQDQPGTIPEELPPYPFIEVFLNPFRDNKISWFYPEKLSGEIAELFYRYFGNKKYVEDEEAQNLPGFFRNTEKYKKILIRPEVLKKAEKIAEDAMLKRISKEKTLDFSAIKSKLLPYQVQGVEFATFRSGAVIADELGLGKTTQAIAAALMKKEIFGFSQTLIVCPATIKHQWKQEIEQLTGEKAMIVEGTPAEREKIYRNDESYFQIVNYETLIRDLEAIVKYPPDFIILDEAQRIKNYASVTSAALKAIPRKHALVITSTPIESRLIDLYSIILFVDPDLLAPLWEFSYQHCYFDENQKNRIVGYYDLDNLNDKLKKVMLRREKRDVTGQLPRISEINIPVKMHPYQQKKHLEYAREAAAIFRKKILTAYDIQRTTVLVNKMRMVAASGYLVDDSSSVSPKLEELGHVLADKLNILTSTQKVVIFTEWKKTINIIARMLRLNRIGFVETTGDTPVKQRRKLIESFRTDEQCKVFLSTETGGSGLDLKIADTVINFEVPSTAAQKNQRLGPIDRISQDAGNLVIINLIAENSLEEKIASGLALEKILTDNLLSPEGEDTVIELTHENRTEFLKILNRIIKDINQEKSEQEIIEKKSPGQMLIDFSDETKAPGEIQVIAEEKQIEKQVEKASFDQQVLNENVINEILQSGIDFLSGLLKTSTGKPCDIRKDSISFDPETDEIIIKFKIS